MFLSVFGVKRPVLVAALVLSAFSGGPALAFDSFSAVIDGAPLKVSGSMMRTPAGFDLSPSAMDCLPLLIRQTSSNSLADRNQRPAGIQEPLASVFGLRLALGDKDIIDGSWALSVPRPGIDGAIEAYD